MLGGQKNRKREDRDDGHRGLRLAAAIVAGTALLSTGAAAQTQSWRHGIIEPKSDAGFQVMAVRAGFAAKEGIKLELPHFQNDITALRGHARMAAGRADQGG
jgi:ABC-type nitrate/sulfonate/bicarbonate transport system substrate-binding protein